jgi:hypothetical protein
MSDRVARSSPSSEPIEAERREAHLVEDYLAELRRAGHVVNRLRIVPEGEAKPIFTDLFGETSHELVEANGTVTREAIRMAIGQLNDYSRFIDPEPVQTVLLPSLPRPDLLALLACAGIATVYRADGEWHRVTPT